MYRTRVRRPYVAPVVVSEAKGDPFKLPWDHPLSGLGELTFLRFWDLDDPRDYSYVVDMILRPAGWR